MAQESKPTVKRSMPPWPYKKITTDKFFEKLLNKEWLDRPTLTQAINGTRLYPFSPLRWVTGIQGLLELVFPWLHQRNAKKLQDHWKTAAEHRIASLESEIDSILSEGSHAEKVVQDWLRHVCAKARPSMPTWMPGDLHIEDIVLPPSEINETSQEIDNLLVCPHGIYLIEVKSWRQIATDGSGQTAEGQPLGSPLGQLKKKVEHVQAIVGPNYPVHALAVLPRLKDEDIPFGLDDRVVNSLGQLMLILRSAHQRAPNHRQAGGLDMDIAIKAIRSRLDTQPRAKVRHMRWLAQHHPNPAALKVMRLDDEITGIKTDMQKAWEVPAKKLRTTNMVIGLMIPLLLWQAWENREPIRQKVAQWTQSEQGEGASDQVHPRPSSEPKQKPKPGVNGEG